jgi:hypothetical protein
MNPEQQYDAVFMHLQMTHGPHSSLDVQQLTKELTDLSPAIGWPKFLLSFNHYVTTLAEMKQTDPMTGVILRGPKPAPAHVPHQPLTGDAAQDGLTLLNHYNATREAQEQIDRDYPLGGPEFNHKPPDPILKSILLGHVQTSPNTAISKIYADSLERPEWTWTTIFDKLKIVSDNLHDGPHTPSSSRSSSATTSPSDSSSNASLIRQIKELKKSQHNGNKTKKCKNCNGPHDSWDCPSKKCYYPGCNAAAFDTAEDRRQHYVDTHARQKSTNGGRGSTDGRGGRAGRGGQAAAEVIPIVQARPAG